MTWFWFALLAMLCMACNSLLFTFLERGGVPTLLTIVLFKAVSSLCFFIPTIFLGISLEWSFNTLLWLGFAGILSNLGDQGQLSALGRAPNPGYALGVIFTFPVLIALTSLFIPSFNAELSPRKILGMVFCILGAVLLATSGGSNAASIMREDTPSNA